MDASVFQNLPLDLWVKIFQLTREPDGAWFDDENPPDYRWPPSILTAQTPLLLTLVCKPWRTLARSCADLWTSVKCQISDDTLVVHDSDDEFKGLADYLACSGSMSLSLIISFHIQDCERANNALQLLYPHFGRLSALRVSIGNGVLGELTPIPRVAMPHCQLIQVNFWQDKYTKWLAPLMTNELLKLHALDMREYVSANATYLPVEQQLGHLLHLQATANNFAIRPVDILRCCERLVTCTLYFRLGPHSGGKDNTHSPDFIMPYLQSLSIRVKSSYYWRDVFGHATCPSLRRLRLNGTFWPVPTFAPFLQRSRCQLQQLTLSGTNISASDLIQALQIAGETLETLVLGCQYINQVPDGSLPCFTDNLLDALDPVQAGRNVLAPHMHTLQVECQGPLETTDGRFIEVVQARMAHAGRTTGFRHITLTCGSEELQKPHFHQKDMEGVALLPEQHPGVSVRVYPDPRERDDGTDAEEGGGSG